MKKIALMFFVCVVSAASAVSASDYSQTGRYVETSTSIDRSNFDPLEVIVDFTFPNDISTVGEALLLLTEPSGYRFELSDNDIAYVLFEMPLPFVHRALSNITLRDAISVLSGKGFVPLFDESIRQVYFHTESDIVNGLDPAKYKERWLKITKENESAEFVVNESFSNSIMSQYIVKEGDSLSKVIIYHGLKYSENLRDLFVANNPQAFIDSNPDRLIVGASIEVSDYE